MGSIWEEFGTVWGAFWALLGVSWLFLGCSKSSFFKAWAQDGLQEAFWVDLGSISEGFGMIWGGFGEEFGTRLETFGPAGADSLLGPPR